MYSTPAIGTLVEGKKGDITQHPYRDIKKTTNIQFALVLCLPDKLSQNVVSL